ncbi:MAG TPA: phosphoribosyltransferase, partial [bacterium]|nr:phosphoribosyltransferase [bacterium]
MIFQNRTQAGIELAKALESYRADNPLIIALPRGGVPVAVQVARHLNAPMDVLIVRKLGAPENPEYAIGALAEGGEPWVRGSALGETGVGAEELRHIVARQQEEIRRRVQRYRQGRPPAEVAGRTVIVVDDGLATGATMMAAIRSLRGRGATRIIVAVPCAASQSAHSLRQQVETVVALTESDDFYAVGQWYRDFHQVEDREVERLLAGSAPQHQPPHEQHADPRAVHISEGTLTLEGDVTEPPDTRAWVVFAHGSGSSRKSPRNMKVALGLNAAGFGTLLFDLLTSREEQSRRNVFDIALLTQRLLL